MRSYEVDVGGDDFTSMGGGALQGGINTGSVNAAAIAEESHNLLGFGTSLGTVELWDPRARSRAAVLGSPVAPGPDEPRSQVTALEFQRSGLTLATGSSDGLIHLYDLRSPIPLLKKDQGYGYPIHTLTFLTPTTRTREMTSEPKIMSADKRIIKIWDARDGSPWTSVEPAVDLNSVAWCKDSGMLLTANEGRQQHSFFIPQLGPAPKWCSFLDNLVEEMAEDPDDPAAFAARQTGEVYDNYKFLTVPQLRTLNLDHLIGKTNLLRPYMHGFFVAQRLYEEARLIANPYVWEEERAKRVKEKIDAERESRIRGKKAVTAKVNRRLAERLLEREEKAERRRAQRVLEQGGDDDAVMGENTAAEGEDAADTQEEPEKPKGLMHDSRFAALFEDEAFAVDETSHEFRAHNPSTRIANPIPERSGDRPLTAAEQELVDEIPGSSDDDNDEESESESAHTKSKAAKQPNRVSNPSYKRTGGHQPRMQISSSRGSSNNSNSKVNKHRDASFESRISKYKPRERRAGGHGVVGEKEISFAPASKKKANKEEGRQMPRRDEKYAGKDRRSASGNVFRRM